MNAARFIVEHETALRLGSFVLVLAVLAVAERAWPVRGDARPARRQFSNLALMAIDTALLRLAFPLLAATLALSVHARGGGLFGLLSLPAWLEIVVAVLILDATIYWQHRLMHAIPLLWRMHRVHHTDTAFDVTLGVRFHPLEIALSMGVKLGAVWLLGPPAAAVVAFEILLAAASLFTHTDVAFPGRWERALRALVVTPSMHRVHHSVLRVETDSNYGFLLSGWDRLFRSYRRQQSRPERSMPIGLTPWRAPAQLGLGALLLQPFRRVPAPATARTTDYEDDLDA
ncbi:MAG: sterol desaturase family protein [Luteimonas sp.]|nr:sterol desaturase family protein [Luteimonas sp.]